MNRSGGQQKETCFQFNLCMNCLVIGKSRPAEARQHTKAVYTLGQSFAYWGTDDHIVSFNALFATTG